MDDVLNSVCGVFQDMVARGIKKGKDFVTVRLPKWKNVSSENLKAIDLIPSVRDVSVTVDADMLTVTAHTTLVQNEERTTEVFDRAERLPQYGPDILDNEELKHVALFMYRCLPCDPSDIRIPTPEQGSKRMRTSRVECLIREDGVLYYRELAAMSSFINADDVQLSLEDERILVTVDV